jgi:hypothetical protein
VSSAYAKLAQEHLRRAEPHIPDGDTTQAITWLHLAAEAAVEAMAESQRIDTAKRHQRKAQVARELYEADLLPVDLQDTLLLLNEARKRTNYDGSEVDLRGRSTQELFDEIAAAVNEVGKA